MTLCRLTLTGNRKARETKKEIGVREKCVRENRVKVLANSDTLLITEFCQRKSHDDFNQKMESQ